MQLAPRVPPVEKVHEVEAELTVEVGLDLGPVPIDVRD